jgi:hypothetical protein
MRHCMPFERGVYDKPTAMCAHLVAALQARVPGGAHAAAVQQQRRGCRQAVAAG